jgi:hypothetical protein
MKKLSLLFSILLLSCSMVLSQSVKGRIYNDLGSKRKKNSAGLVVYLVPSTAENSRIVRSISTYEAACPDRLIKTAKNYQVAITDKDGYYFFANIKPGGYLVKVCTHMGGFYSFHIRSAFKGTIALPDFEADPPVK